MGNNPSNYKSLEFKENNETSLLHLHRGKGVIKSV